MCMFVGCFRSLFEKAKKKAIIEHNTDGLLFSWRVWDRDRSGLGPQGRLLVGRSVGRRFATGEAERVSTGRFAHRRGHRPRSRCDASNPRLFPSNSLVDDRSGQLTRSVGRGGMGSTCDNVYTTRPKTVRRPPIASPRLMEIGQCFCRWASVQSWQTKGTRSHGHTHAQAQSRRLRVSGFNTRTTAAGAGSSFIFSWLPMFRAGSDAPNPWVGGSIRVSDAVLGSCTRLVWRASFHGRERRPLALAGEPLQRFSVRILVKSAPWGKCRRELRGRRQRRLVQIRACRPSPTPRACVKDPRQAGHQPQKLRKVDCRGDKFDCCNPIGPSQDRTFSQCSISRVNRIFSINERMRVLVRRVLSKWNVMVL